MLIDEFNLQSTKRNWLFNLIIFLFKSRHFGSLRSFTELVEFLGIRWRAGEGFFGILLGSFSHSLRSGSFGILCSSWRVWMDFYGFRPMLRDFSRSFNILPGSQRNIRSFLGSSGILSGFFQDSFGLPTDSQTFLYQILCGSFQPCRDSSRRRSLAVGRVHQQSLKTIVRILSSGVSNRLLRQLKWKGMRCQIALWGRGGRR